ncbi:MAG: hypothetical protein AB7S77_07325 [Desulfatirhabdiaceae bacterium]
MSIKSIFSSAQKSTVYHPLLWLMAWGILIRLMLMPFFAHVDFLSEYGRIYQIVITQDCTRYLGRIVVVIIEFICLRLFLPLIPNADSMLSFGQLAHSTASLQDYFFFVNNPQVFRTLFLLKIPYLMADMGTALVISRIMAGKEKQTLAIKLWLFNPVTLYAFYIFGRFESIPIFFIAVSCWMIMKNRILLAAICLGIALNCREIIIIYVPFFCLSIMEFPISRKAVFKTVIPSVILLACFYVIPAWIKNVYEYRMPDVAPGSDLESAHAFFAFQFNWFLPFIFSYVCIGLANIEIARGIFFRFVLSSGLCVLFFLMIVAHSAHYVSWMILFPILMMVYDRDILKPFVVYCCTWIVTWLFMTDSGVFTLFLASPLSIDFSGFPNIPKIYAARFGPKSLISLSTAIWICRNGYAACILYLIYKMCKRPVHVTH